MSEPTQPDPEAIYVALSSGVIKIDGKVHHYFQGRTYRADHPPVAAMPHRFTLAPEDALRRQQAAILQLLTDRERGGGPAPGDGLDVAAIRGALREWTGPWPPGQDQITGYTSRRVRQVLHDAHTSWRAELQAVKR